ncbi:delta-12 fatty acid desaturase [Mycena floridula]|nr:delta-12 fatty acid desaturase [Mycena floridula]
MLSLFTDAPEYKRRNATPFVAPKITLAEVHAAIPEHLRRRDTLKSSAYVARDIFVCFLAYRFGIAIDGWVAAQPLPTSTAIVLRWTLWTFYCFWQSFVFAAFFVMGHEAGHGSLSSHNWFNHVVGFPLHTVILVPYYAWRSTHSAHHRSTNSIEREETYVPNTRSDLKLPSESSARPEDYDDIFEDIPLHSLIRVLSMVFLGWYAYLFANAGGSARYPLGTNHFSPYSPLFRPNQRKSIAISTIGLVFMSALLYLWAARIGTVAFIKLYLIPYILANGWLVAFTYLQHSDPSIPHYRGKEWTFLRGALSTVDRPFFGWIGRFFFHNICHDHIAHHMFSYIPFYNQPQVTEILKEILKDDYNYDSTNSFRAMYRSFNECKFIEDEGDIVFHKNKHGRAARFLAKSD